MNTTNRNEVDERDTYDRHEERRSFNWLPLLLIPLFFAIGWMSRGAVEDSQDIATQNATFGVGGGPGELITPTTTSSFGNTTR